MDGLKFLELFSVLLVLKFSNTCAAERSYLCDVSEDKFLNFTSFAGKYGYRDVESYTLTTEDGYILTLYRISRSRDDVYKPPVLLAHGLWCSSIDWLENLDQSLGFILLENSYDVWFANFRGTVYSQTHEYLVKEDPMYWDFSFHELGVYDLPVIIDEICLRTGYSEIFFIGHSQGASAYFALMSTRPEYNAKIKLGVFLSAVAFYGSKGGLYKKGARAIYNDTDTGEMYIDPSLPIHKVHRQICSIDALFPALCSHVFWFFNRRVNWYQCRTPVYFGHMPAGVSSKMLQHYAQLIVNDRFCPFDYGDSNIEKYGQNSPPDYDISLINSPVLVFKSSGDNFVLREDLNRLETGISNFVGEIQIDQDNFTHFDFVWGIDAPKLVYYVIVDIFDSYNN